MLKHYKNAKILNVFDCINGDILVDNGQIVKIGKFAIEDAEVIDLHGLVVLPALRNYACDVRGLSSSETEKVILMNISNGITDIILITDDLIFGKYILNKYKLKWKIATSNLKALEDNEIKKERILLYADPTCDDENSLDEISNFAGRKGCKVYINMFYSLQATGELNSRTGQLPIHYIESFGLLDRGGYLSGAICSDKEDYRLLSEYDFEIVTRPIADLRRGNGLSNAVQIKNAGLELSVGTCGELTFDLFQNGRALLLGTRGLLADSEAILESEVLDILCGENAIAEGMRADFIVLEGDFDSLEDVINFATSKDILMTVSNGEIIYIGEEKNAN